MNNQNEIEEIVVGKAHFVIPITSDEAKQYLYHRKSKVAKELKNYILKCLKKACEKVLEID